MDLVALLGLVELDPAHPELGNLADDGPAVTLQPTLIAGGEIVLPLRDRDVGIDVDFAEYPVGEIGRVVYTGLRVGFPRIHRAFHSVLQCALARRLHGAVPEQHDRLGTLRMQEQQGGEYPRITVPERVARRVGGEGGASPG